MTRFTITSNSPLIGQYYTRYDTRGNPIEIVKVVAFDGLVTTVRKLSSAEVIWYFLRRGHVDLVAEVVYESVASRVARRFPDWVSVW